MISCIVMGFLRENKSSTIIETVMWITEEDIVQGYDIKGVFICDKDIGELIARLRENGVKIDLAPIGDEPKAGALRGERGILPNSSVPGLPPLGEVMLFLLLITASARDPSE